VDLRESCRSFGRVAVRSGRFALHGSYRQVPYACCSKRRDERPDLPQSRFSEIAYAALRDLQARIKQPSAHTPTPGLTRFSGHGWCAAGPATAGSSPLSPALPPPPTRDDHLRETLSDAS
jgi:hypothetical protein